MTRNEFIQRAMLTLIPGAAGQSAERAKLALHTATTFADALETESIPFDKHSANSLLSEVDNDLDAIRNVLDSRLGS